MINLARVRADTPGCLDKSFLDSAGSSLPPTPVLDATLGCLRRESEIGGYLAAAELEVELSAVRGSIARLIGADAAAADRSTDVGSTDVGSTGGGSIALTDSASRAWTSVFDALIRSEGVGPGDRVLITEAEYAGNAVAMLHKARRVGFRLEVVPNDPSGQLDLEVLDAMLDDRVRIVSLVHMPSNGGLVNPVREVVDAAHRHGALVLLDACQTVGQLAVDVAELGVDALAATGRKWLRAPRGTGFLYVRPELIKSLIPGVVEQGGATWSGVPRPGGPGAGRHRSGEVPSPGEYTLAEDARRFEFWEHDVAARVGLGAAVDYLLEIGIEPVERAVRANADALREGLSQLPGVQVRDCGDAPAGIVSFTVAGCPPDQVREHLRASGVIVTVSPATSALIDMTGRGLDAVVRASPHYFVAPGDLERCVDAVGSAGRDA